MSALAFCRRRQRARSSGAFARGLGTTFPRPVPTVGSYLVYHTFQTSGSGTASVVLYVLKVFYNIANSARIFDVFDSKRQSMKPYRKEQSNNLNVKRNQILYKIYFS
ncbi:unnamed protein product [Macrosiphum euphorbiae]|uniref:Uncharacterized protein n=1 Tax=Macrosiphum euphorbiae TaxID=13131 RepID=A0AAV0VRN3_9HEMI|nr:unnamed protein product [Macrosiphum euphorbiae]